MPNLTDTFNVINASVIKQTKSQSLTAPLPVPPLTIDELFPFPSDSVPNLPMPAHLGITSQLASGKHIIMWDFDNKTLTSVRKAIEAHWNITAMSTAYIVQTNEDAQHFHVYSFTETDVSTGHSQADAKHNAHSKELGFRTLRVTPKNGYTPRVVDFIKGNDALEVPMSQLTEFALYPVHNPGGPYAPYSLKGRLTIGTYDLMQGVKFLSQLEQAQKTVAKAVPSV